MIIRAKELKKAPSPKRAKAPTLQAKLKQCKQEQKPSKTAPHIDSIAIKLNADEVQAISKVGIITYAKDLSEYDKEYTKALTKKHKLNPRLYDCLAELNTKRGLTCLLSKHKRAKAYKLTFKGLMQYNTTSELLRADLIDVLKCLQKLAPNKPLKLERLDLAIDISDQEPLKRAHLSKTIAKNTKRTEFKFKNTTYFKTQAESMHHKRTNERLDIKTYYKQRASKHRVEFCFKGSFFNANKSIDQRAKKVIAQAIKNTAFDRVDFGALSLDFLTPNKLIDYFSHLAHSNPLKCALRSLFKFRAFKQQIKAKQAQKLPPKPSQKQSKQASKKTRAKHHSKSSKFNKIFAIRLRC